ncbi:MAG: Wadjet anti-phage system protein JetA family protein [Saccharofermentanales bacterium]
MNTTYKLFDLVPQDFFRPLTGKYKGTYVDCLLLVHSACRSELSFIVDKENVMVELERYFEAESTADMVFDEDNEVAADPRAKANAILRRLKECGWIDSELTNDFKPRISITENALTFIEAFTKIIKNEETEYQSVVSQIHATLLNRDGYVKPYEYIIKRVIDNTEELMSGLKRLNTNIKKYIDAITNEKSTAEIIRDFFDYHREVGSKAYHRINTSDNISYFRSSIIENLNNILSDENIFGRAVSGFMELNQTEDRNEASDMLRNQIFGVISALKNYDDIAAEIKYKHSKYLTSAVSRAKFLLNNTNNAEGKISSILKTLAEEFNEDASTSLYDDSGDDLLKVFNIFPQGFIDGDSLYVVPISRRLSPPEELAGSFGLSQEERDIRRMALHEKSRNKFSRRNINDYVNSVLQENKAILASALPLSSNRDFIRLIFISLYGHDRHSAYRVIRGIEMVEVGRYRFNDFTIERI